ncbi:Rcs stress response system protein RcsF (plasmid) [Escherichia coli]|nr:Rcs stress response system protein RcsF [Escherichia coli]
MPLNPVRPFSKPAPQPKAGHRKPTPRILSPNLYQWKEELNIRRFRDLGEVSGDSCQASNQDSPPSIPTARKRMQINASKMKANAVLLHSCEVTSGT